MDKGKGGEMGMTEREHLIKEFTRALKASEEGEIGMIQVSDDAARKLLELLKEPDKEITLADLDAIVDRIAIRAKAEGRFFSPYEVGLALVQHGQHDERFQWGETIKYSPSEVEKILNEVKQDKQNSDIQRSTNIP